MYLQSIYVHYLQSIYVHVSTKYICACIYKVYTSMYIIYKVYISMYMYLQSIYVHVSTKYICTCIYKVYMYMYLQSIYVHVSTKYIQVCTLSTKYICTCIYKASYSKPHQKTCRENPKGELRYSSILSLTSALDGVGWVTNATPQPLYLRKREPLSIVQEAGWVDPNAGLEVCGKTRPQRASVPGPLSP